VPYPHISYPSRRDCGKGRPRPAVRVLVACGHGHGEMDIYDETSDMFTPVTGDTKTFPELYPGMHLLPNHVIFYSRTGWGSAGAGGGPYTGASDDQSAYFALTGTDSGCGTTSPRSARPDLTGPRRCPFSC
jgi:hypothetical protein